MSGALKEFTDQNFASEVLSCGLPVVVDFWAERCGPCKMLAPILEGLAAEYEGTVAIGKLNVDTYPETASKYRIMNLPTLLFFKDGNIVEQHVGLLAKGPLKAKIDGAFKG
ncbi:MAG: thioredoxin [Chitinispirillia bacterium]|nr:thioredoxin [Chitinispirillia bacterium]MCL2268754.1 thioredoxin [Chitinispirillia bacterium]